jgi:hypothetical protein
MLNDILNSGTLVLVTGFITIFSVVYICQALTLKLIQHKGGRLILFSLAAVGIVLHETSHLFSAICFRHKVTKVCFFKPSVNDNTLGYVIHSYNARSFYQVTGCFFIGLAPIILAPAIVWALTQILIPDPNQLISLIQSIRISTLAKSFEDIVLIYDHIKHLGENTSEVVLIWLIVCSSFALSCCPSPADIKVALKGLISGGILFILGLLLLPVSTLNFAAGAYVLLIALCIVQFIIFLTFALIGSSAHLLTKVVFNVRT